MTIQIMTFISQLKTISTLKPLKFLSQHIFFQFKRERKVLIMFIRMLVLQEVKEEQVLFTTSINLFSFTILHCSSSLLQHFIIHVFYADYILMETVKITKKGFIFILSNPIKLIFTKNQKYYLDVLKSIQKTNCFKRSFQIMSIVIAYLDTNFMKIF